VRYKTVPFFIVIHFYPCLIFAGKDRSRSVDNFIKLFAIIYAAIGILP